MAEAAQETQAKKTQIQERLRKLLQVVNGDISTEETAIDELLRISIDITALSNWQPNANWNTERSLLLEQIDKLLKDYESFGLDAEEED
jgi:hypothetical protein